MQSGSRRLWSALSPSKKVLAVESGGGQGWAEASGGSGQARRRGSAESETRSEKE